MKKLKHCIIAGCNNKYYGRGYCRKHYDLWRRKGFIPERTQRDPNEFVFTHNTCEILMYDSKCNYVATAIINKKDYEKIKGYKWHLTAKGDVATDIEKKKIPIANLIMGIKSTYTTVVDHLSGIKLDNRRSNLNVCSNRKNLLNKDHVSGIRWYKELKKWRARIGRKHIGYFNRFEDAVTAKQQAMIKYK